MFHARCSSIYRRLWKPAAVTGVGVTAVAFWFEEILLYVEEILALILIPIMAGVIYVLNILFFKSRMPKGEDLKNPNDRGVNQ
jgi:hypothetical protein